MSGRPDIRNLPCMVAIKRSLSQTPSPQNPSADTKSSKKPKPPAPTGSSGAKARIPNEAKAMIAEHIIKKGLSLVDVDELCQATGLNKQQIRSQLVDNRQNVRKQLLELAKTLQ